MKLSSLRKPINERSKDVVYIVQYDDKSVLGMKGKLLPKSEWYMGSQFSSSEEANRWASVYSKGKIWRLIESDWDGIKKSSWVKPEDIAYWQEQQKIRFPDRDFDLVNK